MIRAYQPRKASFLFQRISTALVIAGLLSVVIVIGTLVAQLSVLLLLVALPILWALILLPTTWAAFVAFGKEHYEVHADHLVCRHGGLLSDGRTELDVRNITHVRLRIPWLRHKLFGIGDVRVESAGSASSEITFQSIVAPEALFQQVQEVMRGGGYSLQGGQVLYQESPGVVGALTDVSRFLVVAGFGLIMGVGPLIPEVVDLFGGTGSTHAVWLIGALVLTGGVVALLLLLALVIRYLDMRRRTYTVHEDMVVYTEGFLTRDNAMIPFENIADASTTRSFWDQLLGLYDVRVSCQGSGSEIVFRRLTGGEELKASIARLVTSAGLRKRAVDAQHPPATPDPDSAGSETARPPSHPVDVRPQVAAEDAWTATLKMNMTRAVLQVTPALLFPPAWILAVAFAAIRASRTEFQVGADSLSQSYSFIGSTHTQFAYDKVTGVQVSRTPIDRLFQTMSVEVWSIGAPTPIQMVHIPEQDLNLDAFLRQCGIPDTDEPAVVLPQSYGLKAAAFSQAPSLVFLALCLPVILSVAVFASPFALLILPMMLAVPLLRYGWTRLRIQRQSFRLFRDHFEAHTGIWKRQQVFVRYGDVKKVETVQIPLTTQGSLSLHVAGERVVQTQNGELRVPNVVHVAFIEQIERRVDALDALMLDRIEAAEVSGYNAAPTEPISVSSPSLRAEGAVLFLVGFLFPPLWLLLPLILWQAKVRRYLVEEDRVVRRDGIFFKRTTSISFHKLDSIQQVQGAIGKAFGSGKVTLLTAGSSKPDLVLANITDHEFAYTTIRAHYSPGRS